MFRYSPRHGNGRAQVFITCVSFTDSSPITLTAGVVCSGRGVVCYLLGIYPPDTHRPSFFYMRTGTYYGLLKSAVIFTTSPKWHCKSTNIFGNHQTKNQKSLYF